jgi:hypothetical protein
MSEPHLFRYVTAALCGRWRRSREDAMLDALKAGQAAYDPAVPGGIRPLKFARIEERPKRGHD